MRNNNLPKNWPRVIQVSVDKLVLECHDIHNAPSREEQIYSEKIGLHSSFLRGKEEAEVGSAPLRRSHFRAVISEVTARFDAAPVPLYKYYDVSCQTAAISGFARAWAAVLGGEHDRDSEDPEYAVEAKQLDLIDSGIAAAVGAGVLAYQFRAGKGLRVVGIIDGRLRERVDALQLSDIWLQEVHYAKQSDNSNALALSNILQVSCVRLSSFAIPNAKERPGSTSTHSTSRDKDIRFTPHLCVAISGTSQIRGVGGKSSDSDMEKNDACEICWSCATQIRLMRVIDAAYASQRRLLLAVTSPKATEKDTQESNIEINETDHAARIDRLTTVTMKFRLSAKYFVDHNTFIHFQAAETTINLRRQEKRNPGAKDAPSRSNIIGETHVMVDDMNVCIKNTNTVYEPALVAAKKVELKFGLNEIATSDEMSNSKEEDIGFKVVDVNLSLAPHLEIGDVIEKFLQQ